MIAIDDFEDLREHVGILRVAVFVSIFFSMCLFAISFLQIIELRKFPPLFYFAQVSWSPLQLWEKGILLLWFFPALWLLWLICQWVYRAKKNAYALGSKNLHFGPFLTAAFTFIPIVNLVMPYLALREIYASDSQQQHSEKELRTKRNLDLTLFLYWLLNIISTVVYSVAAVYNYKFTAENHIREHLLNAHYYTCLFYFISILSMYFFLSLISQIYQYQDNRLAELAHEVESSRETTKPEKRSGAVDQLLFSNLRSTITFAF